jgi:hypothetical protein
LMRRATSIRAANDNAGRRITATIKPLPTITVAEIEVFGALLAEIESAAANDNNRAGKIE